MLGRRVLLSHMLGFGGEFVVEVAGAVAPSFVVDVGKLLLMLLRKFRNFCSHFVVA